MSAYVVSKPLIDLLVRAAENYGRRGIGRARFRWWRVDEDGDYAGWNEMDDAAERNPSGEEWLTRKTPSQVGQILVDANVLSVHHLYPNDDVDAGALPGPIDAYYLGPYVYPRGDLLPVLTPGQVFDAIDTFDYQACEHPSWRKSEAFQILDALRHSACRSISEDASVVERQLEANLARVAERRSR